jgi:hypothetical protein
MSITSAILQIAAYLLPFLISGLTSWRERQKGEDHEANIQEFREALAEDEGAASGAPTVAARLADQHDRVLAALRGGRGRGDGAGKKGGS